MPKRQRIVRHKSDKVQGEGSWVCVAQLTVGEMRKARQAAAEGGDAFELGVEMLKSHIIEWNWVDDEGNPFLQVPDSPDVVDELIDTEISFLGVRITGSATTAKN